VIARSQALALLGPLKTLTERIPAGGWPLTAVVLLGATTVGIRAWPILNGSVAGDIANYRTVGQAILDGHFSELYSLPYPYPPLWMFFEAWAGWLSQRLDVDYSTIIKLPILAADVALAVFAFLILRARGMGPWRAFAWSSVVALSPVLVLVTGYHGQFDSIAIAFLVAAAYFGEEAPGRSWSLPLSATLLGLAIAFKAFPVLVLPFFLWRCCRNWREVGVFSTLAALPTVLVLGPYVLVGWDGVREGLLGYSGVTDHGWASLLRAWLSRTTGDAWTGLPGPGAGAFLDNGRVMFLAAWAVIAAWYGPRHRVLDSALLVFLLFLFLYPGLSSQYLTWVVPLGVVAADMVVLPYMAVATAALLGASFSRDWALELYYWGDWGWWVLVGLWVVWRFLVRPAPEALHRRPLVLSALLLPATVAAAVIFSLQAAEVFRGMREIVSAF
jgi:hypothetical protein